MTTEHGAVRFRHGTFQYFDAWIRNGRGMVLDPSGRKFVRRANLPQAFAWQLVPQTMPKSILYPLPWVTRNSMPEGPYTLWLRGVHTGRWWSGIFYVSWPAATHLVVHATTLFAHSRGFDMWPPQQPGAPKRQGAPKRPKAPKPRPLDQAGRHGRAIELD